jgi:hypothetical protein
LHHTEFVMCFWQKFGIRDPCCFWFLCKSLSNYLLFRSSCHNWCMNIESDYESDSPIIMSIYLFGNESSLKSV